MSWIVGASKGNSQPFAVLTPYLIPETLRGKKIVNLGDGFILRAIERLLGRFPTARCFSPRIPLADREIATLAQSPATILAGANQLHDNYTVWPGLDPEVIDAKRLRLFPFGIGLHGEPGFQDSLSEKTKSILLAMHRHIDYSSWRCPHTVRYLRESLPMLADQFLMTGCPVVYDRPLLDGSAFVRKENRIAVTVTERGDFWERETRLIELVAQRFKRADKYLVLHQNYSPPGRWECLRHRLGLGNPDTLNPYQRLRRFAVRHGFRVVAPSHADECIALYQQMDLHVGSRLHAHLLFLSRAKRSVLVPIDGRSPGMAEFLGFPLLAQSQLSIDQLDRGLQFDFEIVRCNAQTTFATMSKFVQSCTACLPRQTSVRSRPVPRDQRAA